MTEIINKEYSIYSEFDLEKHAKRYVNYLEVIIHPSGKVEYAVPSHQEKLISIAQKKYGWTRKELMDACPPFMYADFLQWLMDITGCICVWTEGYMGKANRLQLHKIEMLRRAGVMK